MVLNASVNAPVKEPAAIKKTVRFTGSTDLLEGQGVCYDWDRGTQTAKDGRRSNYVELPTILNARYFAGVCTQAYAGRTGGRFIDIYLPGSQCNVLSRASTTIGVGVLTCEAGGTYAGYFRYAGFPGEGTCVPLQTVDRSSAAGNCQVLLQTGPPSGLVEVVVTNTDGLLDGGATTIMVGGVTYFTVDITTGGHATATLADGTLPGQKKAFVCQQAQTNNINIGVTSGVEGVGNADPTDALTNIELDADTEEITLAWNAFDSAGLWVVEHLYGAALT